jgi:hypothetical protein
MGEIIGDSKGEVSEILHTILEEEFMAVFFNWIEGLQQVINNGSNYI